MPPTVLGYEVMEGSIDPLSTQLGTGAYRGCDVGVTREVREDITVQYPVLVLGRHSLP